MKKNSKVFLFLLFVFIPFACKNSLANISTYEWEFPAILDQHEKDIAYKVDTFFHNKTQREGLNACVLVSYHGKLIYQDCFGYENYRQKKLLTDSSTFQLASVSKTITATAVLMLQEKHKLSIEDPVKKYIQGFSYDSITIRDLLCHRSGLQNYIYLFDTLDIPPDSIVTNADVVHYFVENKPPLQALPGHRFQYCNTNYALLAYIVEKVSQKSFSEFVKENIFKPAHMKDAFIRNVRTDTLRHNQTIGYLGNAWNVVPSVAYDGVVGDKGIYASTYDLYLFDQALNHHILLKQQTLAEAYKGYSYEKPGMKNYGLGWRLLTLSDSSEIIYHNGWWRGYTTSFRRRPDEGSCIIVLCNKYSRAAYDLKPLYNILQMDGDDEGDE